MLAVIDRLHTVESALPARRRSGALTREAALVAPAIGLAPGDLLSDALHGPALRFLRGTALHIALAAADAKPSRRRGILAECGPARLLPFLSSASDRLLAAIGAAQALQPNSGQADIRSGEAESALLRRVFQLAAEQSLPILFVALQPSGPYHSRSSNGTLSSLSHRAGVPGIATDASDAVAIYRVAQESLGRARAGGGPALIECVPFILANPSKSRTEQTASAVAAIEHYILARSILTPEAIARDRRQFARELAKSIH
jgi:TPP-dependent pyruvate/acetoin dehydrogenase alpha subunit